MINRYGVSVPGLRSAVWLAVCWAGILVTSTMAQSAPGRVVGDGGGDVARQGLVRVGMLVYGQAKTGVCFSDGFLAVVGRETRAHISRRFEAVNLASEDLFEYPFVVMSGTGRFTLSQEELDNLRGYLLRGGFLLASAGCSNRPWAASFHNAILAIFPDASLEPVGLDHPIFHTLYDIDHATPRQRTDQPILYGLEQHGRLMLVFSPLGLNDTASAGGGCCCCGGNEVRNAAQINANILAYVLTH